MTEDDSDRLVEGLYAYIGEHVGVSRDVIQRVMEAEAEYWTKIVNHVFSDDETDAN